MSLQCDYQYKFTMEVKMTPKGLTGWLLTAGPILTFLVVGILYGQIIGSGDTNLQAVE